MTNEQHAKARLWSVEEVADFLGVKVSWVYSHVAQGDLPHMKVGHYVRFNPKVILQWLEGVAHAG